jgi:putative spermidine/putrescine transport system ATP-binding protein
MLVKIRNVSKTYQSVRAVHDFSLTIGAGECIALLGPSGCGKTTTLNMIAGFVAPDNGSITIGGLDITRLPAYKRDIAMVFQNYALFPHMTVAKNVAYGLNVRGRPREEVRSRVAQALDLVALGGLQERYPRQLSGGQQQRVALARALVIDPAVLLLDEPLSNLDARLRAQTRVELVGLLQRAKVTTLLVTHDQDEAMAMASRVAVMNKGRVEQIARPMDLYNMPASEFVARFVGEATILRGRQAPDADGLGTIVAKGTILTAPKRTQTQLPGTDALYMIRPEHVRLDGGRDAAGPNAVLGIVRQRTFLGPWIRYDVETSLGPVVSHVLSGVQQALIEAGATVVARWNAEDALLLPTNRDCIS